MNLNVVCVNVHKFYGLWIKNKMVNNGIGNVTVLENDVDILEYLKENQCDLILLEYEVHKADTFKIVNSIFRQESDTKIFVINENQNKYIRKILIEEGCDEILIKPFSEVKLIKTIKRNFIN